jgi:hypothetical protein
VDVPEAKERRLTERAADRLENGVSAAKPSPSKSPSKRKPPIGDEEADDVDDEPAAGEGGGGSAGKRRGPDTGGWVMIHKGDNKAFFSNLCCKRDELKLSGKVRVTHFTLSGASSVAPLRACSADASSRLAPSMGCDLTRSRRALHRG